MNDNDHTPIAGHERGLRTTMARGDPVRGRTRTFAVSGERGKMRASDADRDRVVECLNTAYSEGRLPKDEYDARLENALSARTYADLDQLVADLPVAMPSAANTTMVPPWPRPTG